MKQVARSITRVLAAIGDEAVAGQVREEMAELTAGFPVPGLDI